jgi:hypothetical protein
MAPTPIRPFSGGPRLFAHECVGPAVDRQQLPKPLMPRGKTCA